jgi:AraC-like DNA-binding protein
MHPIAAPSCRIHTFAAPYERIEPAVAPAAITSGNGPILKGTALIWWLVDSATQESEFDLLRNRPACLPLIILLPPARDIHKSLPLLNLIGLLEPRAVLPGTNLGSPERLRHVLANPPRTLSEAATRSLVRRGVLTSRPLRQEVQRIFELAPEVTSITKLARRMYSSRRTLGRHFGLANLPVPSHWLQFARLLHVSVQLQHDHGAMHRIAARAGYPDGFTMSNQMKRLIGYRPTEVREHLGWEWIIESWLRREKERGSLE